MVKRNIILKDIEYLKTEIVKYIVNDQIESALQLIRCTATILYKSGIKYTDKDLENYIICIEQKLSVSVSIAKGYNANKVIFYDGYGLDLRGVAYIYVHALLESGYNIEYIIEEERYKYSPKMIKLISKYPESKVICLKAKSQCAEIYELASYFSHSDADKVCLYTYPWDVIGILIGNAINKKRTRFFIDITDHTFWLGRFAFDYCIEFRSFGYKIAKERRGIDENKIKILPFYPIIDYSIPFKGLPFDWHKKFIFSGGGLYKTLSPDKL